jgi:hypothetical protein
MPAFWAKALWVRRRFTRSALIRAPTRLTGPVVPAPPVGNWASGAAYPRGEGMRAGFISILAFTRDALTQSCQA